MFKILIAEDDRELRQLFQHVLIKNVKIGGRATAARSFSPALTA